MRAECGKLGWATELFLPTDVPGIEQHPYWLAGREYPAGRRNLAARWQGTGHGQVDPVLGSRRCRALRAGQLEGVPAVRAAPSVDGRLYGRGSADMKGGLAAAFWALKILSELGFAPAGDLIFESVVDEEFAGGNGTLAARLKGFNADLAVLTEPTRMQVCPACLGAFLGDITIRGKAGMPFMGSAIANPVFAAARVITLFRNGRRRWRTGELAPALPGAGQGAERRAVEHQLHGARRVHPDGHPAARHGLLDRLVLPRA